MSDIRWKSITAVVTNPFAADQLAARKAALVAARCGARLTLFNTFMLPQPTPESLVATPEQNLEAAIRQRKARLEKLASSLRKRGIVVKCEVVWDYPVHEAIIRHVLRTKPDLLVVESHRHIRLARWVLANTDWELIRGCPCALWFVRSARLPRSARILVAVDPRHTHAKPARLDERLLAAASSLVRQIGGKVGIAHVLEPPAGGGFGISMQRNRLSVSLERYREFEAEIARSIGALAARRHIAPADCHVLSGDVSDVLAGFVKRQEIDVLVMGAVSRSQLQRPVIGNTAERVIDRVDCDVFIVKPAGFRTPVPRARARLRRV